MDASETLDQRLVRLASKFRHGMSISVFASGFEIRGNEFANQSAPGRTITEALDRFERNHREWREMLEMETK